MFKAIHYSNMQPEVVTEPGAVNVKVRWLISRKDDARRFAMRLFTLGPKGRTPMHSHDEEHEVFILEGEGRVICDEKTERLFHGSVVYIPPHSQHFFENLDEKPLSFLCIVPYIR